MAHYPVGATLLYDSVPAMEERETRLKATGFFRALGAADGRASRSRPRVRDRAGAGVKLLLVDNDDCFIHTLANYARQTGAEVVTYRAGFPLELIERGQAGPDPDLARPRAARPISACPTWCATPRALGIPVFGVCLGLQGIVEAFGGELGVLDYPMHGKPSHGDAIAARASSRGCRSGSRWAATTRCTPAARSFPACLEVTAEIRRRRHHGRAPPRAADRGRAVPPRVDADAGGRLRPAADGERGAKIGAGRSTRTD